MESVNEKSSSVLVLTFTDENDAAVVPDSGTYRIDDVDSGTSITASTAFTPSASTHSLAISANENRILNSAAEKELRRVTVTFTWTDDAGTHNGTGKYEYEVVNLAGVS